MKTELVLLSLLALSGLFLFNQESTPITTDNSDDMKVFQAFQSWKSKYNKNFNGSDEQYRFIQFKSNFNFINQHNSKGDQLVLGVNEFAAMNNEEFSQIYLKKSGQEITNQGKELQASGQVIDWRTKGAVMPTTNQGNCGSCWAFSSIGGLQGLRFLVDGVLERLSAQQLVSCIPKSALDPGAKDGCGGSEPHHAYTYTNVHGIETWEQYPYVSGQSGKVPACHHKDEDSVFFNKGEDHGFVRLDRGDVDGMKKYIMQQPLNVDVAAGNVYFQFYQGGILDSAKCPNKLDHAILLVAMNDEGETPYWTVQNSWGSGWGIEGGYAKIAIRDGDGVCGINMMAEFPTSVNQQQQ